MMTDEKQLFTPAEAAEYLTTKAGRKITVARLAQLRREGRVKATTLGYNTTVYMRADLDAADLSSRVGRSSDEDMDELRSPRLVA
ncbi:MAG: hypothetical protein ACRDHW_04790 [Ktedonobacteraceae bacterium]